MCKNLIDLIPLLDSNFVKSMLFPVVESLLEDKSYFTRSSIALCIGAFASHYFNTSEVEEHSEVICNFLNILLRDTNTEVRLNALKSVSDNLLGIRIFYLLFSF